MSNIYEIIETIDGDIVLRRAGDDEAPLVSISFSEEAAYFLEKDKLAVAKAMIEAGLMAASEDHVVRIEDATQEDTTDFEDTLVDSKNKTIH